MRNQVLNTHKFGKLFVSSNGDVRAGSVLEAPIGNLHAENIRRLVHKEMTEGNHGCTSATKSPAVTAYINGSALLRLIMNRLSAGPTSAI